MTLLRTSLLLMPLLFTNVLWAQNQLFIPEVISGEDIDLEIQEGTHEFFQGYTTATMGVNGDVLGPTILLEKGQQVTMNVHNQLPEATTVHWHGLHVSSENDGGPHTPIEPDETWSPSFTVLDRASTYWYHPHLHQKTEKHVTMGISGLIIVSDEEESQLDLPRTYGMDDLPLIIQTKEFKSDKQIVTFAHADSVVMVNATVDPYVEVPAQVIRLRLLNGSSMRSFNLGLTDDQSFYQVASDGGLLSSPVELDRLLLAPAERAEILINLSDLQGQTIHLKSYASELPDGIFGAKYPGINQDSTLNRYDPNPLNGNDFNIMQLNITLTSDNAVTEIPSALVNVTPWNEADADTSRTFRLNSRVLPDQLNHPFYINDEDFAMDKINEVIPLDNLEIWSITNETAIAHPFHVHMIQFYILDRNGVIPPEQERGRKDVVFVHPMETVRFITKFETYTNPDIPYMYHCHMLIHEDEGMMGQFLVVDKATGIEGQDSHIPQHVYLEQNYPNPFNPGTIIGFELPEPTPVQLEIFDVLGRRVALLVDEFIPAGKHEVSWDASRVSGGTYFYRLTAGDFIQTKQMMMLK
ncbi:MAG: multicopper oxidase domain-containing protein [Balneolales bacterium]